MTSRRRAKKKAMKDQIETAKKFGEIIGKAFVFVEQMKRLRQTPQDQQK